MSEPKEASFKIQHIIVLESFFKRNEAIDFDKGKIANNLDLNVNSTKYEESNLLSAELIVGLKGMRDNTLEYEAKVRILGVFEKVGEPLMPDDTFLNVNAPAIIFPFVREHISSLALKSGVGNVLLPPINFVPKSHTPKPGQQLQ